MLRHVCVAVTIAVAVASARADVHACGDKYLRVGRSARFRHYASVHPSAILVYAPQWTGIGEFEAMLKRAGHTPMTITTEGALSQALTTAKYQVVITSYAHEATIREALHATSSTAALLPVLYKPAKREEAAAKAAYECLLRPEKMTKFEALEEIDRLIDLRAKGAAMIAQSR